MTTDPAALAAEYLDLKHRAAFLDDRMKQIITELRDLGPGRHPAGDCTITVTPSRRFDATLARPVLEAMGVLDACTETVISSARTKEIVAPAIFESLMVPSGDPRVNVRA